MKKKLKLYFPENVDVYLENLEKSGIIEFDRKIYSEDDNEKFDKLIKGSYKDIISDINKEIENLNNNEELNFKCSLSIRKCTLTFTEFGNSFLKAVIKEIDEIKEE